MVDRDRKVVSYPFHHDIQKNDPSIFLPFHGKLYIGGMLIQMLVKLG